MNDEGFLDEERLLCRKREGMCEGYSITTGKPPISGANVIKLCAAFGLKNPCIFAYNHGYRNHSFGILASGIKYNLILLKNELSALERVQNADRVAEIAHLADMPVRTLASPKTLKIASGEHYRFVRLYFWLDGDTIPWEAYTRKHLRTLGKTLADLHAALGNFDRGVVPGRVPAPGFSIGKEGDGGQPGDRTPSWNLPSAESSLPSALDELIGQNTQMQAYFARKGVKNALERKLGLKTCQNHQKIGAFLTSANMQNLPRQPLHLDFVRGNILWEAAAKPGKKPPAPVISGVIDFEKTALGSPLIDLARTYAFLLVDCPKTEDKIKKYFLSSGYLKYGASSLPIPPKIFANLTNFFLLFDFYKFLSHNPFEDLEKNYHFCRTRDILKERKLLEEI